MIRNRFQGTPSLRKLDLTKIGVRPEEPDAVLALAGVPAVRSRNSFPLERRLEIPDVLEHAFPKVVASPLFLWETLRRELLNAPDTDVQRVR